MDFRLFIEKYAPLTDAEWLEIEQLSEIRAFRKNDIILNEGQVCRYFYFLESGLVRIYNTVDGNDSTKTFTIAPYCFTSKRSFRTQSASTEGIQALDRTVVRQISFDHYLVLEHLPAWNLFMRKLLNEIQEYTDSFYLDIRTMTAEERYKKILMEYPDEIRNKIPLKHLSSFLGIEPQSLSRIRKKNSVNFPK